jgi:hypothetical protein
MSGRSLKNKFAAPLSGAADKGRYDMAIRGIGYFDAKGQYYKTPEDATVSDLAAILGRVGDGDSLASGIAKTLLQRRRDIERIFADHDAITQNCAIADEINEESRKRLSPVPSTNIAPFRNVG